MALDARLQDGKWVLSFRLDDPISIETVEFYTSRLEDDHPSKDGLTELTMRARRQLGIEKGESNGA